MDTKNIDLAALKIDRASENFQSQHKSRKWLRRTALWILVVIALGGGALLLRQWLNPGIPVQLATASMTSPAQASAVLTASGYVVARRKAAVASKGTGTLVFLAVEEGDTVKKGQVIARLDDSDVVATQQRARENLRVAEADLNDARQSLERMTALLKQRVVAQSEFDAAEARYNRVVAAIAAARFAVKEADVAVQNTRIIAPFDGTVLKKNADVGEIVAPMAGAASSKAAVVTIADMSSLEVEADVSEANITRVQTGQNCEVALDAYPQQRYPAVVSSIVPTADRSKATVLVKIRFKKYDRRVLPEMSAKITFLAPEATLEEDTTRPVLTVPAGAVTERNGRAVVFQVNDGRAVEVPIVAGRALGSLVEVKDGLKDGDKIIAKTDARIERGVKVVVPK